MHGQGDISFLAGTDASVKLHEIGGWIAFTIAVVQLILLILPGGRAYGLWLTMSSLWVVLAEALQLGSGYGRYLQVHIPLAVLLAVSLTWQLIYISTSSQQGRAS